MSEASEEVSMAEIDRRNALRDEIRYLEQQMEDDDITELRTEILATCHDCIPDRLMPDPVRPSVQQMIGIFKFLIAR